MEFLLTQYSILILAVLLLALVGVLELCLSGKNASTRNWLVFHLSAVAMFLATVFIEDGAYTMSARPFYILEYPAVVLAAFSFGELCYSVAGLTKSREHRVYRWIVSVAIAVWTLGLVRAVMSQAAYTAHAYTALLILPILMICWPIVLFTRNLLARRSVLLPWVLRREGGAEVTDRDKAQLGFLLVCSLGMLACGTPVLVRVPGMPLEAIYAVFIALGLLLIVTMLVTYYSHIAQYEPVAGKISSIMTVIILVVFVGVTLCFFRSAPTLRLADLQQLHENALTFEPRGSGYELSMQARTDPEVGPDAADLVRITTTPGLPSVVDLSFDFPFFEQRYRRLLVHEDGQIVLSDRETGGGGQQTDRIGRCFSRQPAIAAFCSPGQEFSLYLARGQGEIRIFWVKSTLYDRTGRLSPAFEASLDSAGRIILHFNALPEALPLKRSNAIGVQNGEHWPPVPITLTDLPVADSTGALWVDLNLERRREIHRLLLPLAIFLCGVILAVAVLVRAYLDRNLTRPLRAIQDRLAAVDEGVLDSRLEAQAHDEFSDIARGFNRMIHSLDRVRRHADEQTELLELEMSLRKATSARQEDAPILSKDESFLVKLRTVIGDKLDDFDFQVAELADSMALSTRQLHRQTVRLTDQTPATLMRGMRLARAHELLSAGAVNVSQAAYACGYRDVAYFSRLFQKRFGMTPSQILDGAPAAEPGVE